MFRFAQHDKGNARFNRSRSGVRRDSGPFGPKDCLLKVLDLLSDLLQFGLAADDSLGDRSVIRFCSERVEFAKNLLRNELQRPPDRFLAAQMMRKLSKMTFESRQFLRYISAIGKEGNFFQQTFIVTGERQPGFFNSVEQHSAISFHYVRLQCADFYKSLQNFSEDVNDMLSMVFV